MIATEVPGSFPGIRIMRRRIDGAVVARVAAAWRGGRCPVTQHDRKPLRNTATRRLARGGALTVRGRAWRRDFAVTATTSTATSTATTAGP